MCTWSSLGMEWTRFPRCFSALKPCEQTFRCGVHADFPKHHGFRIQFHLKKKTQCAHTLRLPTPTWSPKSCISPSQPIAGSVLTRSKNSKTAVYRCDSGLADIPGNILRLRVSCLLVALDRKFSSYWRRAHLHMCSQGALLVKRHPLAGSPQEKQYTKKLYTLCQTISTISLYQQNILLFSIIHSH